MLNFSNVFSEFGIACLFFIIPAIEFDVSESTLNDIDTALVTIVYGIMAGNMICSTIMAFSAIIRIIKSKCKGTNSVQPSNKEDNDHQVTHEEFSEINLEYFKHKIK